MGVVPQTVSHGRGQIFTTAGLESMGSVKIHGFQDIQEHLSSLDTPRFEKLSIALMSLVERISR